METMLQDARYGIRMLLKNPGFTIAAVLILTLGIAINTIIFNVVNSVILRPLPYGDPERIMVVWEIGKTMGAVTQPVTSGNFADWKKENKTFEDMAAISPINFTLTGSGESELISSASVSANFFDILKVTPILGRGFQPNEDRPGQDNTVIVGYGLWQRYFGADPGLLGKSLTLNGSKYTVIGIMPPGVNLPGELFKGKVQLWTPLALSGDMNRTMNAYGVIGRLKGGVTVRQSQADMDNLAASLARLFPDTNTGRGVKLIPLNEQVVGDVRKQLLILLAAVATVLLIVCANVANLLLARATGRKKEIAIRTALGAGRIRIVRQLLTESVILAFLGGGLGLLLAFWGGSALYAVLPSTLSSLKEIKFDFWVLTFTILVSLVTGLIFGVAPALQVSRTNLQDSLQEGGRSAGTDSRSQRVRSLLVVSEIALAFALSVSSGLLIMSFIRLQQVDPGFKGDNTLTLRLFLPSSRYPDVPNIWTFFRQLEQGAANISGGWSAGLVSNLPLGGNINQRAFNIEGRPPARPGEELTADYYSISPTYLQTMGVPLLKGRTFTERDKDDTPAMALINETAAKRFWPHEDPIGKRVMIADGVDMPREIVGIVGDVKQINLEKGPTAQLYVSYLQKPNRTMTLIVHSNSSASGMPQALRNLVRTMDPDLPVSNLMSMEEILSRSVAARRFNTVLLTIFACLGLVLASVGIYGVTSYSVSQRSHEIGIRIALGAQVKDILTLIIRQGLILSCIGLGIGVVMALALTRWLASLLFEVSSTDPIAYSLIFIVLLVVTLTACYIPARRATKVDPMIVIRSE